MKEIFPIAAASSNALLLLLPIVLILVAGLALVILTATSIGRGSVEVSTDSIRLRAPIYGRSIPMTSIMAEQAQIIDTTKEANLRPKWRTNGIGLPGYAAGWFKLQNGEKALVLMTDRHKVLYLPTREGYSVLVSAAEPERLLASIKKHGSAS
jgi:Bacterial PH domain